MTDAPGTVVLDEDHGSLPAAARPSVPTEGVSFTVDDLAQEIRRVDGSNALGAGALAEALSPFLIEMFVAHRKHVLSTIENSPSSALGGDEPKANAQEPLSGSQALPSASTTNIRALPDTAGEVEAVAWAEVEDGLTVAVGFDPEGCEPLYSQATVSTLRAEIERLTRALRSAQSFIADGGLTETWPGSAIYAEITQALLNQTEER